MRASLSSQLGLRVDRLRTPIRFEQMDGSILGGSPATWVTEPIRLEIREYWELIRFIIVDSIIKLIILGLAWLDKWKPTIWWEGGYRKLRLELGPEPRVGSPNEQTKGIHLTTNPRQEKPQVPGVPEVYVDLSDVFSEDQCDTLPPHRPTDCVIELIPGAKLPKPRIYVMTHKEVEELRRYIDSNLARGFISPSRAPMAAPVLFREKKDGGLRLCVDFCGLNAVSVEPLYPLPLIKDLLATLATGHIFTKLDLREAYYQ